MAGRDVRRTCIDELAVNLVGEEIQIVFLYKVANLIHLSASVEITRRIVRVADEDGACTLVYQLLKLIYLRKAEALVDSRCNGAYHRSGRDGKRHVVGICWLWHDNLVARIKARKECEEHRLRTSRSDDYIVGSNVYIVLFVIVYQLLTIAQIALRRTILENRAVDILYCFNRRSWCWQVGLTDVKVIYMHTSLFSRSGQRC